eukprot:jgi/Botrbrau1/10233/Bobra.0362s0022.1
MGPSFPNASWDHWMRLNSTSLGRECIVPELSRNHNIGEKGANMDRRVYRSYLARLQYNEHPDRTLEISPTCCFLLMSSTLATWVATAQLWETSVLRMSLIPDVAGGRDTLQSGELCAPGTRSQGLDIPSWSPSPPHHSAAWQYHYPLGRTAVLPIPAPRTPDSAVTGPGRCPSSAEHQLHCLLPGAGLGVQPSRLLVHQRLRQAAGALPLRARLRDGAGPRRAQLCRGRLSARPRHVPHHTGAAALRSLPPGHCPPVPLR